MSMIPSSFLRFLYYHDLGEIQQGNLLFAKNIFKHRCFFPFWW
nr:MAG TPA: hypothetical protein [Caudoviricetes sp.]